MLDYTGQFSMESSILFESEFYVFLSSDSVIYWKVIPGSSLIPPRFIVLICHMEIVKPKQHVCGENQ